MDRAVVKGFGRTRGGEVYLIVGVFHYVCGIVDRRFGEVRFLKKHYVMIGGEEFGEVVMEGSDVGCGNGDVAFGGDGKGKVGGEKEQGE